MLQCSSRRLAKTRRMKRREKEMATKEKLRIQLAIATNENNTVMASLGDGMERESESEKSFIDNQEVNEGR
jgi:hypothetical protein